MKKELKIKSTATIKIVILALAIALIIADICIRIKSSNYRQEFFTNIDLYLFIFASLVILIPIEGIKKISGRNWAFEITSRLDQQNEEVKTQTKTLEDQKNLLFHLLRLTLDHRKVDHLNNLMVNRHVKYENSEILSKELRDLRLAKYIVVKKGYISELPDNFILSQYFEITEEGKDCIQWLKTNKLDNSI